VESHQRLQLPLQEAGATPVQEIAYSLATAIDVLDAVRDSGKIPPSQMPHVVGQISFFVNAGVRFIEEIAKMRTFTAMWDESVEPATASRTPPATFSLRRAGQLPRPHRTTAREQRAAHRARDAWRHAFGRRESTRVATAGVERSARSPRPPTSSGACGCSRCSPSRVTPRVSRHLRRLLGDGGQGPRTHEGAQNELDDVVALGGAFAAIDELKSRLVASQSSEWRASSRASSGRGRHRLPKPMSRHGQ